MPNKKKNKSLKAVLEYEHTPDAERRLEQVYAILLDGKLKKDITCKHRQRAK